MARKKVAQEIVYPQDPIEWRPVMNTLTLILIVFLLVLVLGMQFQITALNKKIDEALKRKQQKKYF